MSGPYADAMVHDPGLPAAELLLSSAVADVLTAAVAHEGASVAQAFPMLIDYSPGRSLYVAFLAFVEWPDHADEIILGGMARADGAVFGAEVEGPEGMPIGVWKCSDDPYVPGIAAARDPVFVEELLERLGLAGGRVKIEQLAYVPRSRAVIRVSREAVGGPLRFTPGQGFTKPTPEPLLYLKALRPDKVERTRRAQAGLEGRIPIAPCLADFEDLSLLAYGHVHGSTLFDCLVDGTHPVPDGHELVELLDRFSDAEVDQQARIGTRESTHMHAEILMAIMPAMADRVKRFLDRFGEDLPQPEITIHGDFHEEQLLLGPSGLNAVLDLDDCGRGQRLDDMAMMLSRLYSYAETEPHGRDKIAAYIDALLEAWSEHVNPRELRRRMAGAVLDMAVVPFREHEYNWRSSVREGIERAERALNDLVVAL